MGGKNEGFVLDVLSGVVGIRGATSLHEAKRVLSAALVGLGLQQFVYLRINGDTLVPEQSTHTYSEAWTERYVAKGYERIDPIIGMAWASSKPFLWSADDFSDQPLVKDFFEEADGFGIYSGVTVPLKAIGNNRAYMTMAAPRSSDVFAKAKLERAFLPTVRILASVFHQKNLELRGGGAKQLTKREREVLALFSAGATSAEVAAIFGRSVDTVNEASLNGMKKLGAENKTAATYLLGVT